MSDIAALVLTEDSSKWAFDTVEQVCLQIFGLITPQVQYGDWLSFAPANAAGRAAMPGNVWKSKKIRDQHKVLSLCRAVANQLMRDDGFVFFHFDGDTVWSAAKSENLERFEAVIRDKVRDLIRGKWASHTRVEYAMSKLVHLAPFYSIETWLFANVQQLRQLGLSAPILDDWQDDLMSLDGATKPKDLLSADTRHYPMLARKLRAAALYQLETSFCDTVNRAGASSSLVIRLRQHWPRWVQAQYGLD